jgi:hypothetical protein
MVTAALLLPQALESSLHDNVGDINIDNAELVVEYHTVGSGGGEHQWE